MRTLVMIAALLVTAHARLAAQPPLIGDAGDGGIQVRLHSERSEYRIGELMTISVLSERSAYLLLYYVDASGQAQLIVPSSYSTHDRVYPAQSLQVRDNRGRLLQQRGPRGTEWMQAVVTREPLDLEPFAAYLTPDSEAPLIRDPQGFTAAVQQELARRLAERKDPKVPVFGVAVLQYRVEEP
ncbi:MAG: DUF4384 domain-containing protein [Armatimonadetes bacterium]|nr:DUF4384 domain-containing protein [Armatimonadota bacterium]